MTDRSIDEADDRFACEYCGRRFAEERLRSLHRGQEHPDRLDGAERDAYETAHEAETEELRVFRLKTVAALVLVYFGFLFAYSVFG